MPGFMVVCEEPIRVFLRSDREGFAVDSREAAHFDTEQEAQAAIQALPNYRQQGLSVVPVD